MSDHEITPALGHQSRLPAIASFAERTLTFLDEPQTRAVAATILYVGSEPGAFTTIASAVEAAQSGARIVVHAGTYHEQLAIGKPLSIEAPGRDVTIDTRAAAIEVQAPLRLAGITVSAHRQSDADGEAAMRSSANVELVDVTLSGDCEGLHLKAGHAEVTGCLFETQTDAGIHVQETVVANIRDSKFNGCGMGLIVDGGQVVLRRSEVFECIGAGVHVGGGVAEIVDCHVHGTKFDAIEALDGKLTIRDTTIEDNHSAGVTVAPEVALTFERNIVRRNHIGVSGVSTTLRIESIDGVDVQLADETDPGWAFIIEDREIIMVATFDAASIRPVARALVGAMR